MLSAAALLAAARPAGAEIGRQLALSTPSATTGLSPERLADFAAALGAEVEAGRIPGAVALVARRGEIALFEAVGYRDRAANAPMHKDTIFRIYSMTKPIVSVATMMLVEEGRLRLTIRWRYTFRSSGTSASGSSGSAPTASASWRWCRRRAQSRSPICCATPRASPTAMSVARS